MTTISFFQNLITSYPPFFLWRDAVEILFFSTLFYHVSLWLRKDKQKGLLLYFYSYCLIALVAYHAQLPTISSLMVLFAPGLLVFFALIHQETLQRNFVALKNITPTATVTANWLEQLIRSCLIGVNKNKELLCVIERNDNLASMLSTSCMLNADCEQSIIELFINSQSFDEKKIIWLTAQGKLRGLNAMWHKDPESTWLAESVQKLTPWQQSALFYTTKTDALVFSLTPEAQSFTIIVSGRLFERIDTANALKFMKKYLMTKEPNTGGTGYEKIYKKRSSQQLNH